ncbi:conserved Plasmodium protein, unknown function [Plasmodium relictum]|uniref:PHD-type domain-containing protein n=1 Tax=Plasmodium relictum TaxID=85471 RepID=A0A1J1H2F2_PLARL|nr:conserved Plasmodium protein, unknown function [Plasmodium relictum]CRG99035.1 conserved Plasmodium protein, unknown function [Plasmodium relictum]
MSDPVQVFMENVCHLTGYLHRLLFLMKELDKKEHNINEMIEKKEEIYLEKLNDIHKKKSEKQLKYSNDESNIESNNESNNEHSIKNDIIEDIPKKKENNECMEYKNVKEKKSEENISNYMKNIDDFVKEKEILNIEDENMNINNSSQNSYNNYISKENEENKKKENMNMHSCNYDNNLENFKNKKLTQVQIDDSNNNKNIKIKLDAKREYNDEDKKKENKFDIHLNDENEKKEYVSDIINKDNYEKKKREKRQNVINENNNEDKTIKKIKIFDNTPNNEFIIENKENSQKINSTQSKDCDISHKNLEKTYINSNEDETENQNDSNKFNEEELNNYLNEIMNDREQCIALLREKICINNQISYMIKHDYEKLKKQYDKLYTEMEMSGESPPYLYNSYKNKNVPSELEDYNINMKNKTNYNNYHYGAYNIDRQKTEENENFLTRNLSRKNINKYNEYNTCTDKVKKSKKIKKNKIENDTSSKSLKNLNDKNNNQKMRISLFSAKNNYENKIRSSELNDLCNKTEDKGKNYVNQIKTNSSLNLTSEYSPNKKINERCINDYSKGKNAIPYDSLSNCEKNQLQNKNAIYDSMKQENNTSLCDVYVENNVEEDICPICSKGESASSEFGMVGCDSCNKWFHFECVNYENNDCNESWFCPKCVSVNESNMKSLLK